VLQAIERMKADAERASMLDSEVVGVAIKVICASGRMFTG
jgi:hypothetical protein